jgi:hypothetical protein
MTLPPPELLERLSLTLRKEIGPAVDGDYPRTQAFMAAVVVEKLARQLMFATDHERADTAEMGRLFTDLDAALSAERTPPAVRAIVDEGMVRRDAGVLCRLIEELYAHRDELGPASFDAALGRVRVALRARIDRQSEYAA